MWVFGRRCTWGSTSRSLYARQWQVSNRKASWERVGFDWNTSWSGSPSPSCGPSWRCYPKGWGREWEEEGWPYCRDTAGWNTGTWTRTSYSYLSSTNYPGNTGCPSITSPFSAIHHQTITVISKVWQVQRWFILEDSCSYILSYIYIYLYSYDLQSLLWSTEFILILTRCLHHCGFPRMKRYFEPQSGDSQCSKEALAMYRDPKKRNQVAIWKDVHIYK